MFREEVVVDERGKHRTITLETEAVRQLLDFVDFSMFFSLTSVFRCSLVMFSDIMVWVTNRNTFQENVSHLHEHRFKHMQTKCLKNHFPMSKMMIHIVCFVLTNSQKIFSLLSCKTNKHYILYYTLCFALSFFLEND